MKHFSVWQILHQQLHFYHIQKVQGINPNFHWYLRQCKKDNQFPLLILLIAKFHSQDKVFTTPEIVMSE